MKNIDFFSSKFISQELQGLGNENQRIEKAFLDEYQPTKEGEEQIFLDKKFFDNGKYIISSLNSYSAEWYPSGHPKEDLKKLVVELQVTDKLTWKNFSLRGTADIPKYYYGSFDFDTSATDFVVFKDLSPSFTWEYSEKYEVVSVEKNELSLFQDGDIKTQTFVTEKKFNDYTLIDETIKKDIPLDLFLDPAISACGTLNSAGATYDLTTHVSTVTPGTCFTVTAANVTLDCHGYWVNYSGATPSRYGVYTNQFNTTVKNCKINNFNTTGGYYDSIGIAFWGADNGTILNCYANNSNSAGIYLTGNANYNNITSSMGITANSSQGMRLHDCHYNILLNNLATTKTNEGLGITGGSSYNIIINQTATSNSGRGVFFWQGAHDNVFIGLNASTLVSGEAIRIHNATNNIIMDCVSLDGASYDVYYYTDLGSTGNVFLNCDYNTEYITPSNSLIRQWYYQAYVNYSNGSAASGVNVTARNSSSVIIFTDSTTSSGLISRQNATEYVNYGGTRTYYNNYTINASKSGYTSDTNTINFTITENKVNDFLTLDITGDNLLLKIINPTTSNSLSVSSGENISVYFNVSDGGSNVTSGVSINSVFIGGINSTILNMTGVNGSTPEQVPISCVDNYYSSDMEAYSNWTIPGSGDINVTSFFLFQNDTTMSSSENTTIKFYHANGTEIGNTEIIVYGTGAREWTYANYSTPFTLTRGKSYYVGMLMTSGFNLARDANHDCANYLPNQGSYYTSPTDWVLDSSVPTASLSTYHYGIFGVGYETYGNVPSNKYITNIGWQVNVSVPTGLSGLQDLFVNATYGGFTLDDTESNAINYGGETDSPSITFQSPTPSNGSSTTSPVTIVANISDASNTSSWMDLDRSLLGYWAMDYYSATGVYDNSSWGNNLLFGGGASTSNIETGIRGDAFALDRDGGDYLYRGTLALGSSATFEAWGYAYDLNDNMPMLWNHPTPTYTSYYDLFFLSNTICLNTGDSGSNPFKYPNGTNIPLTSISLNEWHHYVVVLDENLNQALLYFDGSYLGNASYRNPTSTTSRTFYLGGPSSSYRWNGSIDEFRLYNRSLSATEVAAAYNSKVNKFNTSAMDLANGQHNYTVYAVDEYGNIANSGLRNFVVTEADTTFPIINWVNPTPNNQDTTTDDFVYLNTTITESNNFSAWFDWNKSLVGYWGFDYYNSTGVHDNSSYNGFGLFQGTLSTSDLVDGERGEGLEFDGDDYVVVGQPDQLNIDPDDWSYSILGWMKIAPGQTGYLVCKGDSTTGTRQYGIYIQSDTLATYIGGTNTGTSVNISDNTWHHVALTFSSSSNGILYVDGKPRTSSILRGSATNTYDVLIGGRRNSGNTGLGYPLTGSLDEVMIFNRTLSPEEVNASYNAGSYRLYNNFTGLDQGTYDYSAYAIDESGNLNITLDREITLSSGETDSPSIIFELPTPSNTSTASNPVTIVANISDASNTSSWIDFDRTLVGYWAMDYYNSTGIYDNSSWDNFGSFVSGTGINGISSGVRGDSLEFYGNGSRLNMGKLGSSTAETFNSSGQLTFSVWINPDTISWQGIMGTNTVRFHMAAPSRIRSGIYNATAQYQFDSPDILSTGQWQHVALTYNRSNGNASSYHNGVLVGSRIILNANLTGAGDYFNVGQNWGDYFDGRLDEAMVFNRTLSQTEIKALYDSKSNKFNTSAMNLADAQHNYTVYAIDEYGNTASSGLRNFVVGSGDLNSPVISFESPTPSNGSTTSNPITIVANISDASNTSSWIDLDRSLVGYWAMDYANSTNVFDNSSYKNNATFQGGLSSSNMTTGVRGEGMDFVGDGGELGIKYSSQYNITEGITLAIWMKRTTTYTQTRDMHLLSRYPAWYFYDAYNSGYVRGDVFIDGVRRGGIYTEVIPNDGNWYHIVYTYNSTTGYARMYTNGVQVDSTNLTGLSNYLIDGNTTADLSDMGWHNLGRGVVLDEAMIFSRSLSQSEVKALYNSKSNKFNTSSMNLSDGKHNYTVYAIDEYGNTANSGERNFVLSSGVTCGTISSSGIYTLTSNLTSTGTCFTVTAPNVTIDCAGYWITYSTGGESSTRGIYTNQFNTTVKNCNILDGNWTSPNNIRFGVFLYGSDNSTLFNNFVNTSNSHAIYFSNTADFNNFTSNRAMSNYANGILGQDFSRNIFINNNGTSNYSSGIEFDSASNNTFINNLGISNQSNGLFIFLSYNNTFTNNTGKSIETNQGILIQSSDNNTFINNNGTCSGSGAGIYLYQSLSNNLMNNNGTSNTGVGIYLSSSSNNTLTGNNATSNSGYGIYLYPSSSNNTLISNDITTTSNVALYIRSDSSNNTFINNIVISSESSAILIGQTSNDNILINNLGISNSSGSGISIGYSSNNTLINNTGISNTSSGIFLQGGANYNTLVNNTGESNTYSGIHLSQSSNNNLTNNIAITHGSSNGIFLVYSLNNTIINQIARTTGTTGNRYGVNMYQSNGTTFRDCINISGGTADVYYSTNTGSVNNTFINCSYDIAKETVQGTGNELIRKWYYQAYVNYSNGSAAAGANVSAYNVSSSLQFTENTNASGWIQRKEVTEYINRVGTRSYFNNYSISPTKSGYYAATHIFNFTITQNKMNDWFTLYNTTCVYLNGNWHINCSESCTVLASYDVQGNNISIVGSGTVLVTGNVTNYQNLHIEGVDTTHICTVRCINGGCFKS